MTTAQPSVSRFQVVERPFALPAKCLVCGGGNKRSVDFGSNIRNYGAVYLCIDCVGEAARQFGFLSPGELVDSKLKAEQSLNTYLNDNNLVVISREQYNTIADAVRSLSDDFSLLGATIPVLDDEAAAQEPDGSAESADDKSDAKQPPAGQKPKSSRQRRSNDVPSDPSNEFEFDA